MGRWNPLVLKIFGPVLIAVGFLGFVLPANAALTSGAAPYNLFHLAFGVLGTALAFFGPPRAAAWFNAGFGAIDLYQLIASRAGLFPSELFLYRPADDVLHLVIGAALVAVGVAGLRTPASPA